jgi:hypothetical protein
LGAEPQLEHAIEPAELQLEVHLAKQIKPQHPGQDKKILILLVEIQPLFSPKQAEG